MWYVAVHPDDAPMVVGCGGWTWQAPGLTGGNVGTKNSSSLLSPQVRPMHLHHFANYPDLPRCYGNAFSWVLYLSKIWKYDWGMLPFPFDASIFGSATSKQLHAP